LKDGGCIANNPTAVAIHEAKCLWPDRKIDLVVSVGTGKVPVRENKGGFIERTFVEMVECATSVDRVHDLMQDTWPTETYFR
jgi:calcium-independent phospholipase A2-gamma